MWRKFFSFVLVGIFVTGLYAQGHGKDKSPITVPNIKEQRPNAPNTRDVKPAPDRFASFSPRSLQKGESFTTQVETKKKELINRSRTYASGRMIDIYPPYADAWVQQWQDGNGTIFDARSQNDGYSFQSAGSYGWGMATSRCWVGVYYVPSQNGFYRVTLWSYQEGNLRVNVMYDGDEVYAYRTLGLWIDGNWTSSTPSELYYKKPVGEQVSPFKGWISVSKDVYLKQGQTYWFTGYSELGGWSSGSSNSWQSTNSINYTGPFSIEFMK